MKIITCAVALIMLTGCNIDNEAPDQCMRARLFESCMKSLPAGIVATKYNDWDEVVDQCDKVSYRQSIRRQSQIIEECGGAK